MTYFILANPNSGAKKGARTLETLLPYLDKTGISYQLFTTKRIGEEADLIEEILAKKEKKDHLLIIGGDGTISLSIDALPEDEPFSYIPAGSGNDFARSLKLSLDPIENFKSIENMNTHDIFIIKYTSNQLNGYALNNIGIGLDAQIVKSTNRSKLKILLNKVKLGKFAYLLTALHVLFTKKPFSVNISTTDGRIKLRFDRAFLITFTKHPYFGGGIKISPAASNLTEDIHLVEFDRHPLLRIFSLIPKVLQGTHLTDSRFIHQVSPTFIVTVHENEPVQIDGETHEILAHDALHLTTQKRTIIY